MSGVCFQINLPHIIINLCLTCSFNVFKHIKLIMLQCLLLTYDSTGTRVWSNDRLLYIKCVWNRFVILTNVLLYLCVPHLSYCYTSSCVDCLCLYHCFLVVFAVVCVLCWDIYILLLVTVDTKACQFVKHIEVCVHSRPDLGLGTSPQPGLHICLITFGILVYWELSRSLKTRDFQHPVLNKPVRQWICVKRGEYGTHKYVSRNFLFKSHSWICCDCSSGLQMHLFKRQTIFR